MENSNEIKNKNSFLKNWKNIVITILSILLIFSIFFTDNTNLNKVNELETNIQKQKNEISTLQTEKTKLNNAITALEEENNTLQKQIEILEEQTKEKEATNQTAQSVSQNKDVETNINKNIPSTSNTPSAFETDNEEEMVWVGETGTKYHCQDCRTLKGNGHQITLKQALAEGREPCKVCH